MIQQVVVNMEGRVLACLELVPLQLWEMHSHAVQKYRCPTFLSGRQAGCHICLLLKVQARYEHPYVDAQ